MKTLSLRNSPPKTESELLARCYDIAGNNFTQLALRLGLNIPLNPLKRKGWVGQAIEFALGADAKNRSTPDFQKLGVELKTLPINKMGKPSETTFITSIPLLTIHQQEWKTSQCYAKLKRILWIPIEGDVTIPYPQRRIGQGFLWSPNESQEKILAEDWNYLTLLISTGCLEILDSKSGEYLQVRPKAANGKSLCFGFDINGAKFKTLPRGFYLRKNLTEELFISKT